MKTYTAEHPSITLEEMSTPQLVSLIGALTDSEVNETSLRKQGAAKLRLKVAKMLFNPPFDINNGQHVHHVLVLGSLADWYKIQIQALLEAEAAAKVEKARLEAEPPAKKEKGPTIRSFAEALMCEVVSHDGDGRPLSHSYAEILERILVEFPKAKTTVACLRWYGVHMRERGDRVPLRPRAQPAKEADKSKE